MRPTYIESRFIKGAGSLDSDKNKSNKTAHVCICIRKLISTPKPFGVSAQPVPYVRLGCTLMQVEPLIFLFFFFLIVGHYHENQHFPTDLKSKAPAGVMSLSYFHVSCLGWFSLLPMSKTTPGVSENRGENAIKPFFV